MKEILDFIENAGFRYVYSWIDKKTYAMVDHEDKVIVINMELIVADMFLHEYFHSKYSRLGEEEIIKKTSNKLKRLKVSKIQLIAEKIFIRSRFSAIISPKSHRRANHRRSKCKMSLAINTNPLSCTCKYLRKGDNHGQAQ